MAQNHHVIRIADKAVAFCCQCIIQHGEVDVAQQRTDYPTLGSSGGLIAYLALLHYSGRKPSAYQAQDPSILDDLTDQLQQDFMINMVKESSDVQIHHIAISFAPQLLYPYCSRMRAAAWSEPITVRVKVLLKHRAELFVHRLLTHPIYYHRYA